MHKLVVWISLLCFHYAATGQTELYVDGNRRGTLQTNDQKTDELARKKLLEFVRDGYLFAGIDSIVSGDIERIYLHKGMREEVGVDSVKIQDVDFKKPDYRSVKSPVRILNDYISSGYPFARISWERISQDNKGRLHGNLIIDPGPFVVNDTLVLLSSIKTKPDFIQQSLGLQTGKPFDELAYQRIGRKLDRMTFLELSSPPDIAFSGGQATTYLDLKENPASSFEGIVGLLPNQGAGGNLLFTGYIDLDLGNLFNAGKQFRLNWQQFAAASQQLSLEYDHAYLLGSSVLLGGAFNLIKQDTTFITRNIKLEIGAFLFGSNVRFDGSFERLTGDLISSDPEQVAREGLADYTTDQYAISLSMLSGVNRFEDYLSFRIRASIGRRSIEGNASLPSGIYDTLRSVSSVFQFRSQAQWQKVLYNKTSFFIENNIGILQNIQVLRNELYRVGGLKSLRGFNENFFFTQNYLLNRAELRQYFEKQSFLFLFYDQIFMGSSDSWRYPFGFGLGLTLDTGNGLFNFVFALGRSDEIPIDINNTKIHLGYTSRF